MILRDLPTIWIGKLVYWFLRKSGRHGAALPGLIAEKINPDLIRVLTRLPEGIIVVSGTNGKTTTTHLLVEVLRRSGKRVFTNHSGSNMTRGLLASIVRFASITGKLPYDVAVLEIDEAYAAKLAPVLKPRACILTNVLRDQLDRFGEIDHTANLLKELAKHCTDLVVFNVCDPRLASVGPVGKQMCISYGYDASLAAYFPNDDDWHTSSKRHVPTPASDYTLSSLVANKIEILSASTKVIIPVPQLPGAHNAINLTAVFALVSTLYPSAKANYLALRPPYGRGEIVVLNGKRFTLQLVKNPAGFRTAMNTEPSLATLIVINDAIADSRDVSWLWDVDVTPLATRPCIYTSGSRAFDIANRLKYADININSIEIDIEKSLREFIKSNNGGVLFLTYTAMLKVRKIIHTISREASK